jgi:hypothetical protein
MLPAVLGSTPDNHCHRSLGHFYKLLVPHHQSIILTFFCSLSKLNGGQGEENNGIRGTRSTTKGARGGHDSVFGDPLMNTRAGFSK